MVYRLTSFQCSPSPFSRDDDVVRNSDNFSKIFLEDPSFLSTTNKTYAKKKSEIVTITIIIAKRRRRETKRIRAPQIKLAETEEVGTRFYTEHFQGEETKGTVIASLAIPFTVSFAILLFFFL